MERWWDWPSAVFLILAIYFGAGRLQTTNWTEHLGRIPILVFFAAVLGMALGFSRFKPLTSFLFAFVFTLTIPGWSLAILLRADTWSERVVSLGGRLGATIGQLVGNQAVRDPILFYTFMVFLYWISAFIASYQLVRNGKPWGGLAVVGLLALIVEYSYDMYAVSDPGTIFSVLFLLFVLILLARIYFLRSRREWIKRGHMVENEVGFNLGRGAAITGLAIVVFAWYSPRIVRTLTPGSNENVTLTADIQRFRDRFEKAVSSLRSPSPVTVESLGDTLGLGRGTNLSENIAFYAKPSGGRLNSSRYYWTGRAYDIYRNDQWESSEDELVQLGPDTKPIEYTWSNRTEVNVDFISRITFLRTLYFPGAVKDISRVVSAVSTPAQPGEADFRAIISDPPLRAGETYHVTALVSTPTIQALQASNNEPYPEPILARYLQLPSDFSPKVGALAKEITQGLETPYDKTEAITRYLRENITYEANLPQMPVTVDPVEWFLFTHKAGFCNYYATAEVLMLRSLGIPARLTVGYATGVWNDGQAQYEVKSKDYHAWPEVFFPGMGWVPFEPTASQPQLVFPQGEVSEGANSTVPTLMVTPMIPNSPGGREISDEEEALLLAHERQIRTVQTIAVGGITLLSGVLAYSLYRLFEKPIRSKKPFAVIIEETMIQRGWRVPGWLKRYARLARRTPIEKMFATVGELLSAWGKQPSLNLTPSEQVAQLTVLVPEIGAYADVLLEEYQRSIYSQFPADISRARRAANDLRANGYRAWMNRRSNRRN